MPDPDLIGLFIAPLEGAGVSYMVTGGVASVIYGDPRFTRDVDVVLELSRGEIPALVSAFDPGAFYVPPVETLQEEVARSPGGHFNVIHRETSLRADIYLAGDDPLIEWGFERRVRLQVGTVSVSVAPIEYVVLRKLEYFQQSGSDRHLRDVAMMFRISGDAVDSEALLSWCRRLDLTATLERARDYPTD